MQGPRARNCESSQKCWASGRVHHFRLVAEPGLFVGTLGEASRGLPLIPTQSGPKKTRERHGGTGQIFPNWWRRCDRSTRCPRRRGAAAEISSRLSRAASQLSQPWLVSHVLHAALPLAGLEAPEPGCWNDGKDDARRKEVVTHRNFSTVSTELDVRQDAC